MCVDKIKRLESFKKFEICQKLHLKYIVEQWAKIRKKVVQFREATLFAANFFFEWSIPEVISERIIFFFQKH